jgi:RHS repeat-associated protein
MSESIEAVSKISRSTGKERDTGGEDYFGARYHAFRAGRFLTPDWSAAPQVVPYAKLGSPQSLNLYGYVQNNPVTGIDPDGHMSRAADGWGNVHARLGDDFPTAGTDDRDFGVHHDKLVVQNQGNARTREFSTTPGAVSVTDGKAAYSAAVDYLRTSSTMKGVVDKFEDGNMPVVFINDGNDRVEGGKLYWDPHSALNTTSGGRQSPALGLGHEMTHATGRTLGTIIRSMISDRHYDNREERRVIQKFETPAAIQLHEGTRTDHSCAAQCTFWVASPVEY